MTAEKKWSREGLSKGGILVSQGVNSYGDGPERYVGVLLDFSPADQAMAMAAPALYEALKGAREYVVDALEAYEHSDGRELLKRIDAALTLARGGQ